MFKKENFKILEMFENNMKFTRQRKPVELTQKLATETKTPHSWYSYFTTIVGHCYGWTIEGP